MAKIKVYSRYPSPIEFRFTGYEKSVDGGTQVAQVTDKDRIILNGTTEIVNHTLVTKDGALTLFGMGTHDLKKREYTLEDFERLKNHPLFKQMLDNGNLAIDSADHLSTDFDGVGALTPAEIAERNKGKDDADKIRIA